MCASGIAQKLTGATAIKQVDPFAAAGANMISAGARRLKPGTINGTAAAAQNPDSGVLLTAAPRNSASRSDATLLGG